MERSLPTFRHVYWLRVNLLVYQLLLGKSWIISDTKEIFRRVLTLPNRGTSNETLGSGTNLTALLHPMYPLLTADELKEFNEVYNPAQFSSEDEWIRTATGEPGLRSGVR